MDPQFLVGRDDSTLESDEDGALDWEELAAMTDPDDPTDFPPRDTDAAP
jgi:hypothetical protein